MATVDVVDEGFVPKLPVIPAGHPVGENCTVELKPFAGTTLTVAVPGVEASAVAVLAVNVKLGWMPERTEKLWLADVDIRPLAFCEATSKLYVAPGVRFVSVTEWLVTRLLLSEELEP